MYRWLLYLPSQECARTSCVSFIDTPLVSFSLSLSFIQLDRSRRDKDSQISSSLSLSLFYFQPTVICIYVWQNQFTFLIICCWWWHAYDSVQFVISICYAHGAHTYTSANVHHYISDKADSQLSSCFISRLLYIFISIFDHHHMDTMHVIPMRKMIDRSISSNQEKKRSLFIDNWISDFGSIKKTSINDWHLIRYQHCNYHCTLNDCTNMYMNRNEWITSHTYKTNNSNTSSRYQMSFYSITTHA